MKIIKRKVYFIAGDILFIIFLSFFMLFFREHIELVYLSVFITGIILFYLKGKKEQLRNLIIAFLTALIWSFIGKSYYGYNYDYVMLYGVSLLPLFAWTLGLYLLYVIYKYHLKWFKIKKNYQKIILYIFIYWFLLITMETIAFHIIGIRDIANINYEGLPICNCIHAPTFMKFVYFSLGIIYFALIVLSNKFFPKTLTE